MKVGAHVIDHSRMSLPVREEVERDDRFRLGTRLRSLTNPRE
jgi:hypothetical protein